MIHKKPFILTKIIATMGPSCATVDQLIELIEAGVRVFRLNFSHGTFEQHFQLLQAARQASEQLAIPVGILGDLCGPKIRVGQTVEGGIMLESGQTVIFQRQPVTAGEQDVGEPIRFSTSYDAFVDEVQVEEPLLIDDGLVRLRVIGKQADELTCQVTTAGRVSTRKGVNLPQTRLSVPSITDHDWACADWALEHGVDFLALSFVRHSKDVIELRRYLKKKVTRSGIAPPIIAKIEKPQAIDDLDAIVQNADGVMIARGDLGVEMDLARVPIIQKSIIALAHDYGKPVIVATQMLQSMIDLPTPTRAEVSDVANAIFEGTDAVMLSGETAVGRYPLQAVRHMARIALAIQADVVSKHSVWGRPPIKLQQTRYRTAALAHGVSSIVQDLDAKLIVVWSQHGGGARYLSQNRPTVPILAASSDLTSLWRMTPLFAVHPIALPQPRDTAQFIERVDQLLLDRQWAQVGDPIVIVSGEPIGTAGVTNQLRIHYVGDACQIN